MNEQIEQLETQLTDLGRTKRVLVYAVLFLSMVYMSWTLFGETMYDEIESEHEQIASLESKLQRNSSRSLEQAIEKTKRDNLELQDAINHLHFEQQFVETKLQGIDFIFYSEAGSAEILDAILKYSVDHSIALERIQKSTMKLEQETLLQPRSRLSVSGEGSFANIVKLLNYIESLNALLLTENLHVGIDENNATRFELDLLHYGVTL